MLCIFGFSAIVCESGFVGFFCCVEFVFLASLFVPGVYFLARFFVPGWCIFLVKKHFLLLPSQKTGKKHFFKLL